MDKVIILAITMSFLFTFINGFHDGCNVIATIIASRSMSPKKALLITCIAEFIGPLILGTNVANTIAKGIVNFDFLTHGDKTIPILLLLSAILSGIIWNILTWWMGMPSSSSHALIGGLLGAGIAVYGIYSINWHTFLYKVVLVLLTSPLIGFFVGYIFLKIVVAITRNMHPHTNGMLKRIQLISMIVLGISHSSNDAQKSMGIVAIIIFLTGATSSFIIPLWVQVLSALSISMGLSLGAWRLIRTVGIGIFNVKPIHSFSSQIASASTIITASLIGGPVSTTQIVASSVMGVGTAERKNAVRWDTVKNILRSWIFTIPASMLLAALIFYFLRYVVFIKLI
jgi:inorganic phosphate transporter, PiT family